MAHDNAAGSSSSFAAWAAAESATPQVSLAALSSPEPELPVPSRQQVQPAPGQHAAYRSVAHDIAAGRSSSFAAWATAGMHLPELSLTPVMAQSAAVLEPCLQYGIALGEPAASSSVERTPAAGHCSGAAAENSAAESSPSPTSSPELGLSSVLCSDDRLTSQPAPRMHESPAAHSLGTAAYPAAVNTTSELMSLSAECSTVQAVAGGRTELRPDGWQEMDGQTAVQPGVSDLSRSLPGSHRACSDSMRVPTATGSMAGLPPAQASADADHHKADSSATGCEAFCISPAAVQGSQICGAAQGAGLSQGCSLTQGPCRKQSEAPGSTDGTPSLPMQHHAQHVPLATSADSRSPARHGHSLAGGRRESYDPLQAARQVFGRALECYSPALALRGWDGSIGSAFTAWQHATVMLWQRRLQTAAPLICRRRYRCAEDMHDRCA